MCLIQVSTRFNALPNALTICVESKFWHTFVLPSLQDLASAVREVAAVASDHSLCCPVSTLQSVVQTLVPAMLQDTAQAQVLTPVLVGSVQSMVEKYKSEAAPIVIALAGAMLECASANLGQASTTDGGASSGGDSHSLLPQSIQHSVLELLARDDVLSSIQSAPVAVQAKNLDLLRSAAGRFYQAR